MPRGCARGVLPRGQWRRANRLPSKGHSDTGDELPAYVRNARGEADPERVGRWVEELNRTGQTVLRTGFFKTLGFALISWALSVFFALPFVGTPAPIWIPVWEPLETPSSWAV